MNFTKKLFLDCSKVGALVWMVFVLLSCATSLEGRKQLILMPDAQMDTMGASAFEDMKAKTPIARDARKNGYVRCITDLLLRQIADGAGWEVVVFESNDINAFALPGKKIGVYTGMFKVAQTSAQLAAVIGHEIGHVTARHGNERVSTAMLSQMGLSAVQEVMRAKQGQDYQMLMGALGLGMQFGVLLPHGRKQESEADMIGLDLMARAGFDPQQSVMLWQNMDRESGGGQPEWLSTHPSHDTRIRQLSANMSEALPLYQNSGFKQAASSCRL